MKKVNEKNYKNFYQEIPEISWAEVERKVKESNQLRSDFIFNSLTLFFAPVVKGVGKLFAKPESYQRKPSRKVAGSAA